jgi:hypothetical protein
MAITLVDPATDCDRSKLRTELMLFGSRSGQRDKTLKIAYADRAKNRAEKAKRPVAKRTAAA